jgi:hypothetical protein
MKSILSNVSADTSAGAAKRNTNAKADRFMD